MNNNPYVVSVAALTDDQFTMLKTAVAERECRNLIGVGTLSEAADVYRPDPHCPKCGCIPCPKDGKTAAGLRRHKCPNCGNRFVCTAGSVLEHCKKPFPTWVHFVRLMTYGVSLEGCADLCEITHQTAFEWRHRVFATVDNYQDRIMLRGRVWIDEMYIDDSELEKGPHEARKRGLSKQKICIAVGIDASKNPVAVVCGHGKPSAKRLKEALGSRIAKGSVIVHDKERSHGPFIKDLGCADEAYKADIGDPVYLECMSLVNSLCSWLRRYLTRYVGMKPSNLQSYLNWFVYLFRVNQAKEKWPKNVRVVRHLLMSDAYYRSSR